MKQIKIIFVYIAVINLFVFGGYHEQVASDSPVAWWRLEDYRYKDGLVAEEATGNITDAVFQGDVMTVEAGIDGKCGWFNGNQAGIDIGNTIGKLLDQSNASTFEAWFRNSYLPLDSSSVQRIFATRIDGGAAGIDIGLYTYSDSTSYLKFAGRSSVADSYMSASASFDTVDQWTHVVCVADYTAKKVSIYINGALRQEATVDFASDVYVYGEPTQSDQIGRAPDLRVPYRGYIDEVAVYDKALSASQITAHYQAGSPQEPGDLWVSQIDYLDASTGRLIGSPTMIKYDDGVILTGYNVWGDSLFKISYNNGLSWIQRTQIDDFAMGTLFEHNGETYLFGITTNPGHICISKTTDYGVSWTPRSVLFQAELVGTYGYHTGPVPVIHSNGRIYRVFEERVADERWPIAYAAVVVWADENSDLLDPASWTMTNAVEFDPSWPDPAWECTSPGWLEGNVVENPDGEVVVLMRYHTNPVVDKAAILTLSEDDTVLSFDPETGFIDMPGGMHKFDIHRDPVTGLYLTLNNNNTDLSRPAQRNTLSLVGSEDLRNWYHIRTVIQDNSAYNWYDSMVNVGFQYVVWEPDGDDIIFMSRTGYDGAINYHDSNRMTFHRLENYLDFVAPCGDWGYLQMDFNRDCLVDMKDFSFIASQWLLCSQPYADGCINMVEN
ncbi:MAG: LamG-like jellyroll fold domain-containing protein [Sedimentisphaeraceae bacterium JB056]